MKASSVLAAALIAGVVASTANAQQISGPQLAYVQPLTPAAVQIVQSRLRAAGDYAGRADGIWGQESFAALERFQQTHGLQTTGQLNPATVAMLRIDPATLVEQTATVSAAPAESAMLSPRTVRDVQGRLAQLGYFQGQQDGVWGPATQDALARFQQGRGLQPNAQLNPATVAALGMSSGLFAARPAYHARHYASAATAGSPNCGTPSQWKACPDWRYSAR